jgi:hypothetical protein
LPQPPDSLSRPESSSRSQNLKALPSFGTIMPISGGSAMEFETKKQLLQVCEHHHQRRSSCPD